ncbi:hypothetical protein [Streptomyces sp. FIT100]|nr:hypothetical protein [Streptomyces sp. FIT100]
MRRSRFTGVRGETPADVRGGAGTAAGVVGEHDRVLDGRGGPAEL